jgi:hypothetical protein
MIYKVKNKKAIFKTMNHFLEITIRSSVFDRPRLLTIDKDYIEYDQRVLKDDLLTRFTKEEITGIKFGIKPIQGYWFSIGRIYSIDVLSNKNRIIKIRLKTLYGRRKKELFEKYSAIINLLHQNFIDDIVSSYLQQFREEKEFSIAGIRFTHSGIFLTESSEIILWDDVSTKNYSRFYSIHSKSDPGRYKLSEWLETWNTSILYSVSRQILKDKGFYSE